jgi:hypothetical protein
LKIKCAKVFRKALTAGFDPTRTLDNRQMKNDPVWRPRHWLLAESPNTHAQKRPWVILAHGWLWAQMGGVHGLEWRPPRWLLGQGPMCVAEVGHMPWGNET